MTQKNHNPEALIPSKLQEAETEVQHYAYMYMYILFVYVHPGHVYEGMCVCMYVCMHLCVIDESVCVVGSSALLSKNS